MAEISILFDKNKRENFVTIAVNSINNIRETNAQLMTQLVENVVKLITGNQSTNPANGNNQVKEQS